MTEKLFCHRDPCSSCPYRKSTPPGVWAREEYLKLPAWDDPMAFAGTFLCHHSALGSRKSVCRGWLEVHADNMAARLASLMVEYAEGARKPTSVPLYRSGAEACRAGLRGVAKPKTAARAVIAKLTKARLTAKEPAPERLTVGELSRRVGRRVSCVSRALRAPSCPDYVGKQGLRRLLWVEVNTGLLAYLSK